MKKLLLLSLLLPFVMLSCSDRFDEDQKGIEMGKIALKSSLFTEADLKSRSADLSSFHIILQNSQGVKEIIPYPDQGVIADVKPDIYTVTLTSHSDGFTQPAFEMPFYEGSATVEVKAGKTATAQITCTQINAGVYFVYDASLERVGLDGVVPTVTQEDYELVYENGNRESKGYFSGRQAIVSLMLGSDPVSVGGNYQITLNLEPKQLWKITLKAGTGGSLDITAEIDITTIDMFLDAELDLPQKGIEIIGLEGRTIEIYFDDQSSAIVEIGENGRIQPTIPAGKIISYINVEGNAVQIGRSTTDSFTLKFVNDQLVLRDSDDDGFIPIDAVGELLLIAEPQALSGSYRQQGDLTFAFEMNHTIGSADAPFSGVFDGGEFGLSNLQIDIDGANAGLFGVNTGTIRNVRILSGQIKGQSVVGSICGLNNASDSVIENCINVALVEGNSYVGGICGYNKGDNALIKDCINRGKIESWVGTSYFGGITGHTAGEINKCINEGNITIFSVGNIERVGGITGSTVAAKSTTIRDCINRGTLVGEYGTTGGICGRSADGTLITNCHNEGDILATRSDVGGICGYVGKTNIYDCTNSGDITIEGTTAQNIGGIAGTAMNNLYGIERCENSGDIKSTGSGYTAGILAYNNSSRVRDCVNKGSITGTYRTGGILGRQLAGTITGNVNRGDIEGNEQVGGIAASLTGEFIFTENYNYGSISGEYQIGGICGGSTSNIVLCDNHGSVAGNTEVGGLVGMNGMLIVYSGSIDKSANYGPITGNEGVGGIVGRNLGPSSTLTAVINEGEVSGRSAVGGIAGENMALIGASINRGAVICTAAGYLGGICGVSEGPVVACYSLLGPDATAGAGAIVGKNDHQIIKCFWAGNTGLLLAVAEGGLGQDGTAYIFGDGTDDTAWPEINEAEYWGIVGESTQEPGCYWTSLGSWNGGDPLWPELYLGE